MGMIGVLFGLSGTIRTRQTEFVLTVEEPPLGTEVGQGGRPSAEETVGKMDIYERLFHALNCKSGGFAASSRGWYDRRIPA